MTEPQKRTQQNWSIRLGLLQAVVLLGIVTGSMLCAFYLGLVSGQKAGFETAQSINLASVAKLPVPEQYREEDLEEVASEVYAKLSAGKVAVAPKGDEESKPKQVDLTPIETKTVTRPKREEKEPAVIDGPPAEESSEVIRILTEPPAKKELEPKKVAEVDLVKKEEPKTLGSLKSESTGEIKVETERKPEKPVVAAIAKPEPETKTETKKVIKEEPKKEVAKVAPKKPEIKKEEKKVVPPPVKPKETVVAAKTAPAVTKPAGSVSSGWYAQVAAPSRREDAVSLANKLKASGFRAVIESTNVRGDEYYRVLVGPEEEKRYSQTLVDQLKREPYIKGPPFLRFIK
jgi:DedD protein